MMNKEYEATGYLGAALPPEMAMSREGSVPKQPQQKTVFDEIAARVKEQTQRLYMIREMARGRLNRLIGSEPENDTVAGDKRNPCSPMYEAFVCSPMDEAFVSLDDLVGAINSLERVLGRLSTLTGD